MLGPDQHGLPAVCSDEVHLPACSRVVQQVLGGVAGVVRVGGVGEGNRVAGVGGHVEAVHQGLCAVVCPVQSVGAQHIRVLLLGQAIRGDGVGLGDAGH